MHAAAPVIATISLLVASPSIQIKRPPQIKLWASISVSIPVCVKGSDKDLLFSFAVVNDGTKLTNPELETSRLYINGEELRDWRDIIISNGPRPEYWDSIPPGKFILVGYTIGEHLSKPGSYKIVWKGAHFTSNELEFRRLP